jgi:hypothetical protein
VGRDFAPSDSFLATLGRAAAFPAGLLLQRAVLTLAPAGPLLSAPGDTPTKRYGPKAQGAGLHPNPTPGPTDPRFLYGHVRVTLARVATPPLRGAFGLPILARLCARPKDLPGIPRRQGWSFRTRLVLADELVTAAAGQPLTEEIHQVVGRVIDHAA